MMTDNIPNRRVNPELIHPIRELYHWKFGTNPTNFTAMLYTLMSKADGFNVVRIALGFPNEVRAFRLWQGSPSEQEFFDHWMG